MVGTVNIDANLLFPRTMGITRKILFFFLTLPFFCHTLIFLHKENILPENSIFLYCEFNVY